MIENTKCYSGIVTSYFANHACITIKISDDKNPKDRERVVMLSRDSMKEDKGIFGPLYNEKAGFEAIRQGLTLNVFIRDNDHPKTAEIAQISPNYR